MVKITKKKHRKPEQLVIDGVEKVDDIKQDVKPEEPPRLIIRISSLAVKIAYPFLGLGDTRHYLNGINIRPLPDPFEGAFIAATNGHGLIVIRDPNAYIEQEAIVKINKEGLKHINSTNTLNIMSNGQAQYLDNHLQPVYLQPGNCLIEGEYPRMESIIQTANYYEGIYGAISSSQLRAALKIPSTDVRFFTRRDEESPLLFKCGTVAGLETMGAILKKRDSFESLPDWFPKPIYELTPTEEQFKS